MITGENFIGNMRSAVGDGTFQTYNPELNENNPWSFIEASSEEVETAALLASAAYRAYKDVPDEERAFFLEAIADEMESRSDEIMEVYCIESGLSATRFRIELGRTVYQLRMFAQHIRSNNWRPVVNEKGDRNRLPVPKPELKKTYIPLGPIAVFGSSNFPLAYSTAGGDTASALACGCPVIVKSHPMHAGTGELVAGAIIKAAERTGMPNGVFSNLNSSGIDVGVELVSHPAIKGVGFTGSIRGGRALMDLAAARNEPIPVFAEMGSTNPVVISTKALQKDMDHWVEQYTISITNGTGQFCTNPGLIIGLEGESLDQFIEKLSYELAKVESTCMLHPSIKDAFNTLRAQAIEQVGIKKMTPDLDVHANYGQQTLLAVHAPEFISNSKLKEEVFGPFSIVIKCTDLDEIKEVIQSLDGQLTGTLIAGKEEIKEWKEVVEELQYKVGRLVFNGVPTGVEVCQAMNHGGPYPASSDARFTAVGTDSMKRWLRPIVYQNFPEELLPTALK